MSLAGVLALGVTAFKGVALGWGFALGVAPFEGVLFGDICFTGVFEARDSCCLPGVLFTLVELDTLGDLCLLSWTSLMGVLLVEVTGDVIGVVMMGVSGRIVE